MFIYRGLANMLSLRTALAFNLMSLSMTVFAQNKVETVSVANDVLYFTTSASASHTLSSCVEEANKGIWAVAMYTPAAKGMQVALNFAAANGHDVAIESAGDCRDLNGFERPASVKIIRK